MENERDTERMRRRKALFEVIGSEGSIVILQILNKKGKARYKDFREFLTTYTLNSRIKDLLRYDLIRHHMHRGEVREEWYEITEKGKSVLELLNKSAELVGVE